MSHPYRDYEKTELWKVVQNCINELLENQDLDLTTKEEYVIGYICKSIDENILQHYFKILEVKQDFKK